MFHAYTNITGELCILSLCIFFFFSSHCRTLFKALIFVALKKNNAVLIDNTLGHVNIIILLPSAMKIIYSSFMTGVSTFSFILITLKLSEVNVPSERNC